VTRNSFQITPNLIIISTELFWFSLLYSLVFPMISKASPSITEPLSMLRYGSRTHKHDRDASPINDHQRDQDAYNDMCAFHEYTSHWTINIESYSHCYFDTRLVRDLIIGIIISSSISLPTRLLKSSRDIPSSWPIHTLHLYGCNLTKWVRSIYSSRGWTNTDLDTYASAYPFGIHVKTFMIIMLRYDGWCTQGSLRW
jgi:hypothetical protein